MNTKAKQIRATIAGLLILLGLSAIGSAQSVWVDDPTMETTVGMEVMIPSFDDFLATEFPSAAFLLHFGAPIGNSVILKADLPVSHLSAVNDISETDIGNIYLGLQFHEVSPGLDLELGGRLPTAPDDGSGLVTGMVMENYRLGTYMLETVSFSSNAKYFWQSETGLRVKAGGGPDVLIPTGDGDTELFLNYYGQILFGPEDFSFGGGMTGLLIVTEKDLSFGDRTIHDLGILGSYKFDSVRLGTYIRVPLDDDINDIMNFVLGLDLTFSL